MAPRATLCARLAPAIVQMAICTAIATNGESDAGGVRGPGEWPEHLALLQREATRQRPALPSTPESPQTGKSHDDGSCSLLLFMAVGDFERASTLVKENLEHLRESLGDVCKTEVFLNHYDSGKQTWQQRSEKWAERWYEKHVTYSANKSGFKLQAMRTLMTQINMTQYDWIWAVDEDVNMTKTDIKQLLHLADHSGALIAMPAFTQRGDTELEQEMSYPMQAPNSECLYRYAPVLEVIFPLFRPAALKHILWNCNDCFGETTVWGLDRMWCAFSARLMERDRDTACAIIDDAPVVHQNFKTLKGKYNKDDGVNGVTEEGYSMRYHDMSMAWMRRVQALHRADFVGGPSVNLTSLRCVSRN